MHFSSYYFSVTLTLRSNTFRGIARLIFNHLSMFKSDLERILAARLVSFREWDVDRGWLTICFCLLNCKDEKKSQQDVLPILIKYSSWLQVTWRWTVIWHERWEIGADVAAKVASLVTTAIAVIIRWRTWGGTWRTNAANSRCISAPTVRIGRLTSPIFKCTWWNTPDRASYLVRSSSSNIGIHERFLNALSAK